MKFRTLLVFMAMILAVGCKKAPAPAATAPAVQPGQAAAIKPVPALLPEVLARVNGDAIGRPEFERALRALEEQAGGQVPPDRRDVVYRQVLDQIVAMRLFVQAAHDRKLEATEAEVDAQVAEVRKQFPDEAAFTAALAQRQLTPESMKADVRRQLAAMKLVDADVKPGVTVTEQDVDGYYQKNPDRFQEPEAVHTAHILIRLSEKPDGAARKKAREDIDKVFAELKKKGSSFAALAKKYSQDASAVNGGDLGFVPRGQTVPAFEQAAFALQEGQVSAVVESPFGFHIIKAMERRPGRTVPLAEVRTQVGQFLTQEKMQEKTNAYVEKLKAKAKVEILI